MVKTLRSRGRLGLLLNSRGQRAEYTFQLRVDWWEFPAEAPASTRALARSHPVLPALVRLGSRMHDTALFGAEVSAIRDLRWAQLLLALSVVPDRGGLGPAGGWHVRPLGGQRLGSRRQCPVPPGLHRAAVRQPRPPARPLRPGAAPGRASARGRRG